MLYRHNDLEIFPPSAPEHFAAVRKLFREYYDFIFTLKDMLLNIDVHHSDEEIADLETGKYAAPSGALLLATLKGKYIGVVGLRILSGEICEMKRLYVAPEGRGASAGYHLALQIIKRGRELGYKKMRLDTHPSMKKAHALYYSLGFYDIPRYNANIIPGALFMELTL